MPVEFLSDERVAAFGRFAGELAQEDLERFFYLDDSDRELIGKRRGQHNRLGFAVQVGTVRFLGTFLQDPREVPASVVEYVAGQLSLATGTVLEQYAQRVATVHEHAREIRVAYGYRNLEGSQLGELSNFVRSRAWTHGEGPTVLFEHAVSWLRRKRVLLPGASVLIRLVAKVRDQSTIELYEAIVSATNAADERLPSTLSDALDVGPDQHTSRLESLRAGPTRLSGPELVKALVRVADVQAIGAGAVDLSGLPVGKVRSLSRYGLNAKTQTLRRLAEPRRTATLTATVMALEADAIDDALDLFDLLIATKVLNPSRRATAADKLKRLPELERASRVLARVGAQLLRAFEDEGGQLDGTTAWAMFEEVAARDRINQAVATVDELVPDDTGTEGALRVQMTRRYRTVAPFLWQLATVIPWGATAHGQPILNALDRLDSLRGRRWIPREEIDASLVPSAWEASVFGRDGTGGVDRDAWVVCVIELLRRALRRRDVFARVSNRWGDPRARLLDDAAWEAAKHPVLRSMSLEAPVVEHLADRVEVLDAAWLSLSSAIVDAGPEARVRLSDDGAGRVKLSVDPLEALNVPESLSALRAQVSSLLPRVDLPEILLEVHAWTGFLDAYIHVSGGSPRMKDLPLSIAAVLISQACNVGMTPVVAEGHPALSRDRLGHVEANYLRAETHASANARLIDAQSRVPIAATWGGGLVASVDGLRFVVPVRTINAAPNPKYFGHGRGLTWFNAVNDQVTGIGSVVVPGTVRDSLYVLDTMLNLDGGPKPEMVASDTASYSDMVFGIFTLLGYRFSPRIADLADQRLWRATLPGRATTDYGPLNDVARHKINLARIETHWDDMTRVAASLITGTVRAYDVLRMLTRENGAPNPLGAAIMEYGRMAKTLHLIAFVDPIDPTYRRAINTQLTVQESRHRLARAIFHGRRGQIFQRYREGQEDQLDALGLVLNAIVLWNTRYTDAIIRRLRADGQEILDADVARLSPLSDQHINMLGRYAFTAPTPEELRPLHDPDADLPA